jgi:hypothetical protein
VVVAESGGVLSLAGVVEAWLSFAAWMITVLVLAEVRPFWSVANYWSSGPARWSTRLTINRRSLGSEMRMKALVSWSPSELAR